MCAAANEAWAAVADAAAAAAAGEDEGSTALAAAHCAVHWAADAALGAMGSLPWPDNEAMAQLAAEAPLCLSETLAFLRQHHHPQAPPPEVAALFGYLTERASAVMSAGGGGDDDAGPFLRDARTPFPAGGRAPSASSPRSVSTGCAICSR